MNWVVGLKHLHQTGGGGGGGGGGGLMEPRKSTMPTGPARAEARAATVVVAAGPHAPRAVFGDCSVTAAPCRWRVCCS